MARYAVLIYRDADAPENQVDDGSLMSDYIAYGDLLRKRNAEVGTEALHGPETATVVRFVDGQTLTTDGPYIESKEILGGFYLIEAANLDEAIELAAACPGARPGGAVEVRPCVDFTQPDPFTYQPAAAEA